MKTVFITISRGILVRNILQTGVVSRLVSEGYRVVIITQAAQIPEFVEKFVTSRQVIVEPFFERKWNRLDEFFVWLHRGLIYNSKTDLVNRVGVYDAGETNLVKYWMYRILFQPLSHLTFLRDIVRWFDGILLPVSHHDALFKKYSPSILFTTNVMEFGDAEYVKAAKRNNVSVIGMTKSWDNLSKSGFRSNPDLMLVWSEYTKDEAVRFQNISAKNIRIVGAPQFDIYADPEKKLKTRSEFFSELHIPESADLILYGSEGKTTPRDVDIVEMLVAAIRDGRLPKNLRILVRPHFGYRNEIEKFARVRHLPEVVFDEINTPTPYFYDRWDWSERHWYRLANSLYHTKLTVTSASTLTLDATAFDKPVINIAFDGYIRLPYEQSMTHWYDTEHYRPIRESGVPQFAYSSDELVKKINDCFENPQNGAEFREKFRNRFCGAIDGKSASRIAQAIMDFVK